MAGAGALLSIAGKAAGKATGALAAGAGLYKGLREEWKAKKESKKWYEKAGDRPVYEAPDEYGENVAFSANLFNSNLGKSESLRNLNVQGASARRNLRQSGASFSDLLSGATEVSSNLMKGSLETDVAFAAQKNQLAESLKQSKLALASAKEDEFEYNQAGKYAEFMGRGDAFENRRFAASQGLQQNLFDIGGSLLSSDGKTMSGKG